MLAPRLLCPRRMEAKSVFATVVLSAALGVHITQAQTWSFRGVVAEGEQADAVRGPSNDIHVATSKYYLFDRNGNRLRAETYPGTDSRQGSMDYNPAIATGPDGAVHIMSRRSGSWNAGHELWYNKRTPAGAWTGYCAFTPEPRNYQVALAVDGDGQAYISFGVSSGGTVWGPVKFWRETGGTVTFLGQLEGVWRCDNDQVMRGYGNRIYWAAGKHDSRGASYFSMGNAGAGLVSELGNNRATHNTGGIDSQRRGFPAFARDSQGTLHVLHGTQTGYVYYNKYDAAGRKAYANDVLLWDTLGTWHLSVGLASIAASDDGSKILATALQSDGSQGASNSDIMWRYSRDGGATWSAAADSGVNTDGGEGRLRPVLLAIENQFFMFYKDKNAKGTSLGTLLIQDPVQTPAITPGGGTHTNQVTVALASGTAGATIHYTTNGATPTTQSPVYTAPFILGRSSTVQAFAVKSGMLNSGATGACFVVFIPQPGTIEHYALWSAQHLANPAARGLSDDPDGDRISNWEEYLADTQPHNSGDYLRLTLVPGAGAPVYAGYLSSNCVYALEQNTGFPTGAWASVPGYNNVTGTGHAFNYAPTTGGACGSFRLKAARR